MLKNLNDLPDLLNSTLFHFLWCQHFLIQAKQLQSSALLNRTDQRSPPPPLVVWIVPILPLQYLLSFFSPCLGLSPGSQLLKCRLSLLEPYGAQIPTLSSTSIHLCLTFQGPGLSWGLGGGSRKNPFTNLFLVVPYSKTTFRNACLFGLGVEVKEKLWILNSVHQNQEIRRKVCSDWEGRMQASVVKYCHSYSRVLAWPLNWSPHILALTDS